MADEAIKVKKMDEITKEDFEAYVRVQMSGVTNMWAVNIVEELSGLSKEKIMTIMSSYSDLKDKWEDNRL